MRDAFHLAAAIVILGGALCLFEHVLKKAEDKVISAHQARAVCLAEQSEKHVSCGPSHVRREDFDYCPEAVRACTKNGAYQFVQSADDELQTWHLRVRAARAVTAVMVTVLVLRVALWPLAGWLRSHPKSRPPPG